MCTTARGEERAPPTHSDTDRGKRHPPVRRHNYPSARTHDMGKRSLSSLVAVLVLPMAAANAPLSPVVDVPPPPPLDDAPPLADVLPTLKRPDSVSTVAARRRLVLRVGGVSLAVAGTLHWGLHAGASADGVLSWSGPLISRCRRLPGAIASCCRTLLRRDEGSAFAGGAATPADDSEASGDGK